MKPDLYAELGVDPCASPDELKRAHRALVRRSHPDQDGGDRETFERQQRAYEVLSDPKRRSRYDQTGDTGEQSAARDEAELREAVGAIVAQVVLGGADLDVTDMAAQVRAHMDTMETKANEKLRDLKRKAKRAETYERRLKKRKGKKHAAQPSQFVLDAVKGLRKQIGESVAKTEEMIALHLKVRAVFEAFDYDFDVMPNTYSPVTPPGGFFRPVFTSST